MTTMTLKELKQYSDVGRHEEGLRDLQARLRKEVVMLSELLRVLKQHNMELLEVDFRRGKARAKFAGAEVGLRFDRETFRWNIESRLAFALAG